MNIFSLILKGIVRKKVRTGLTALSIFTAFLMFGLLNAMDDLLSGRLTEGNYSERLIIRSAYGLPLPMAHFEKIKAIEGIRADEVTHNSHIGGYYQNPQNRFEQQAVNAENYLRMQQRYYELTPNEKQAWLQDKAGAVIGLNLAKRFNWKVGDTIPIISTVHPRADGGPWVLNIRGILQPKRDGLQADFMILHFDYLAEGRGGIYNVFRYSANVDDSRQANEVAKRIDTMFRNSANPTTTQTLASLSSQFRSQLGNFGMMATMILGAVFFTMLLVTGNSMMQAFRERVHELAVLKAIGFSSNLVLMLMLAESIGLVLFSGLPSIGFAWLLQDWLQTWFAGLYIRPMAVLQALALMVLLGLLTGMIPALRARSLTIVEALGRR